MKIRLINRGIATRAAISGKLFVATIISSLVLSAAISTSTHAASLTDIVTMPVTTLQTILAPSQQEQTTPSQSQQTAPQSSSTQDTQPAQSSASNESQVTQSQPSTTSQTRQTPTTSVKEAGDQSVGAGSADTYASRQISQSRADLFYTIAGGLALVGALVYILTVLPRPVKDRSVKRAAHAPHSFMKRNVARSKVNARLKTSER